MPGKNFHGAWPAHPLQAFQSHLQDKFFRESIGLVSFLHLIRQMTYFGEIKVGSFREHVKGGGIFINLRQIKIYSHEKVFCTSTRGSFYRRHGFL